MMLALRALHHLRLYLCWLCLLSVITAVFTKDLIILAPKLNNPISSLKPGFCGYQQLLNNKPELIRECKVFNAKNLRFFMSLFSIILWGAIVRSILRTTGLCIPYTVLLMITGLLVGLGTRIIPYTKWEGGCQEWSTYTKIARMPPQIILYVFLPVLIFESAFSMNPHVFVRSAFQILIAALPGMLITTFVTALVCQNFLIHYTWEFSQAALFGAIISATDPVAVVAILKELGTSEALSTMIEGESLLNDGVAILLYEIFSEIVISPGEDGLPLQILRKFAQITLGGPAFGFVMAKIAIFCVSVIFNDATVEITITLVAAYLTYYIGEAILGVSGVMAVVVLGLVMSAERTSISPEVEVLVHHFWEMLGYLANTVLFVIVGIVITETAINSFHWLDLAYLVFLYIALNIIRLFMLLVLSPCLSRLGYGLTWQNMIVMMWGGLRGAVGICLSLEVYTSPELCKKPQIGPKFLLQTAGIVFLTLVVNGTTTQALLDCLGATEISIGRIQDMNNAYKQVSGAQVRTIAVLKNDRFLADAKWELVEKYTTIENPYAKQKSNTKKKVERPTVAMVSALSPGKVDPALVDDAENEPTKEEYREMTEEARLRCLKALKVSFWRQYEQGVLTELAVQILRNAASGAEDKPLRIIHARDLNKYWVLHGVFPWLQIRLTRKFGKEEVLPPKPKDGCRRCCWVIATSVWFEYFIMICVFLNMIPASWETYIITTMEDSYRENEEQLWMFFGVNVVFLVIYVLEAVIKILGRGKNDYFCVDKWNYLDIFLLIASIADFTIAILTNLKFVKLKPGATQALRFARIIRVMRVFRLLRPLFPAIMKIVDRRINEQLFLGYDVGKGFVTAVDDVIKFLPQMISHPKLLRKLKNALEHERLQTVREMGMLQKGHPGIAIAVKTRHASRAVLNQMREALLELKEDGLIDDKENTILLLALEEKMKRLWHSPSTIPSFSPQILLENLPWVIGNDDILAYVKDNATLVSFGFGETISEEGESPNGIHIIVSGMIKVHYIPNDEIIKNYEDYGVVPNMELFLDLTFRSEEMDFFSTGTIIGEKSVLTGETRCATVSCETVVSAYHLPQAPMKTALSIFTDPYDSLESRMWRSYGIKLATALLPTQPAYASWTLDKIRMHLERSAVPIGEKFETMTVPEYISDVIVIQGQVMNSHTKEIYQAPSLVPRSCSKFSPVDGSSVQPRVLVVAHEEIDHEEEFHSNNHSLHNVIAKNTKDAEVIRRHSEASKFSKSVKRDRQSVSNVGKRQSFDKRPKHGVQKP
ncbi:unnamed protein product [Allacma fusca]|uniref:Cyclic nucleotide-binding domain-containing protein n=1 Tax=Allacma fusca TaxID=39272 RepID=A0A8J2NL15_9HEXA|nr:unnamed protein product [Allacma fusca]